MYTTQGAWVAALTTSHQQIVLAVLTDSNGGFLMNLPVMDGSVTADATQTIRRRCHLVIDGSNPAVVPTSSSAQLTPFGNRINLYRGVSYTKSNTWPASVAVNQGQLYQAGYYEIVPIGVFAITEVDIEDTGKDLQLRVSGSDRTFEISTHKLTAPYVVAQGTLVNTVVAALLNRQSGLALSLAQNTYTMNAQVIKEGADPFAEASRIAAAFGYELFADVNGVIVMNPVPIVTPGQAVNGQFMESLGGMLTKITRKYTRQGVSNDFIVISEHTKLTTAIQGSATDTNANSPTKITGGLGDVPTIIKSTAVTTVAQANSAASNALQLSLWSSDQVSVDVIPNAALDVFDLITVQRARVGVSGNYIVDAFTMPLKYDGQMKVSLRKVS